MPASPPSSPSRSCARSFAGDPRGCEGRLEADEAVRGLSRSPWAPVRQPLWLRLRRALARSRLGPVLKPVVRRGLSARQRAAPRKPQPSAARSSASAGRNVMLVSHCDFTCNSALHVLGIAAELHRRGLSPAIAVPANAGSVDDIGRPSFPVLTYSQARLGRFRYPDERGVDLVHAFTPREPVRKLTVDLVAEHGCPYVVHLEDNEEALVSG